MSDKKKRRDKLANKKGAASSENSNKLSKEEDSIARFIRFNCPSNTTVFQGNEVHYFSGKKAVDLLIDSKKYGTKSKTPKFSDIDDAEEFLQMLLEKGLFFRAKKIVLKKKDKSQELKPAKSRDASKSPKANKKLKIREDEPRDGGEEKGCDTEEDKKKKKKVKLVFNDLQAFEIDTNDVYAWIFDPTPFWKKCVGILIVFGTIGGCLFPLWPEWLRLVVYYLSVTGIALFGLLLGVALARTIFYALIWLFTVGRHHLWILPNLMEDCGFFESFQPFYTYEYTPGGFFAKNEQKTTDKKDDDENKKEEGDEKKELIREEDGKNEDEEEESESSTTAEDEQNAEEDEEVEGKNGNEKKEQNGDECEEAQSDSNSNSWERLSENSQKSTAECKNEERKHE